MTQEQAIRFYRWVNPDEIKKHCIVVEELLGQCMNCRTPGINFVQHPVCPKCSTKFLYISTSLKNRDGVAKILNRIKKEGLSLEMVEKDDFDRATAKDAIQDLFKK